MTIEPDGAITSMPTGAITDQVFSPDGQTLYTARNGTITAYDISTGNVAGSWTIGTKLGGIDISADGHSIVAVELTAGTPTGTWPNITTHYSVYQLDLTSGVSRTFDLPVTGAYPEGYGDVSFLADGKVLLAGGGQWQPLTTLDLSTGATTTTSQTFEGPTLTSSADDSHILVSPLNISDAPLFIYTAGSGITASHEWYADNISGFNAGVQAISPDGSLSVEGVSLAVYDSNLHLITKLSDRFPFGAAGLAFSPDGSKLYVLDPQSNEVFVLSTSNWDVLGGYPVGASVTGQSSYSWNGTAPATHYGNALLVSSDGTHLAVDTAVSVQIIDLSKAVSDAGTSAGSDTLIGNSAQNILYGFEGNDTLDGKAGADTMLGGPGDDVYYVDNVSDNVIEQVNDGNDTVYSSTAYSTVSGNVETLVLATGGITAYGNDQPNRLVGNDSDNQLYGSGGDDTLIGNGGDDVLDGGIGNDTMQGGSGNDTYYVESPADVVQEDAGNGIDKIISPVSYTLPANVENLELSATGYPLIGHGNALSNVLIGNGAEDILYGLAGNDTLIGGAGGQYLYGGSGSDTLTGGDGADTLTGGDGTDMFSDTAAGLSGDTITDFSVGDRIVITDAALAGFTFSLSGNTLTYSGGSLTLSNIAAGSFVASAAAGGGVELDFVPLQQPTVSHAGDFNGDHRDDILWRSDSGQFADWLANSNGSFGDNWANSFANVPVNWKIGGIGDFNGDGRDDVLWRDASSGVITDWLGTASGGFSDNYGNASASVPLNWTIAAVGDFNGDHRDDILWRSETGQITDWLGTANGGFSDNFSNASANVGNDWKVVATGDFNGDGKDDILWRNDSGAIVDWLGAANGGFTVNYGNSFASVPTSWTLVGTGDFNGDHRDDILWRSDAGVVTDWLGTANGGFSANWANLSSGVPHDWKAVSIGDFNGDGKDDVLWRNDNGQTTDWLGTASGGFTDNYDNAASFVPTNWHVQAEPFL
jgi:Ca2+-binding RTX toxin-like protein